MRWILNKLVQEGVNAPVVGGVFVSGFKIQTFTMDLVEDGKYRMVELSEASLYKNLHELALLPKIVSNILQVKVNFNILLQITK